MKVRVNEKQSKDERLSYWKREYSIVALKYRQLYPESRLPGIARLFFSIFLILFGIIVVESIFSTR